MASWLISASMALRVITGKAYDLRLNPAIRILRAKQIWRESITYPRSRLTSFANTLSFLSPVAGHLGSLRSLPGKTRVPLTIFYSLNSRTITHEKSSLAGSKHFDVALDCQRRLAKRLKTRS